MKVYKLNVAERYRTAPRDEVVTHSIALELEIHFKDMTEATAFSAKVVELLITAENKE